MNNNSETIDTNDNLTGQLICVQEEKTLNYMITSYLSKTGFGAFSISYLIGLIETNKKVNFIRQNGEDGEGGIFQQVIILKFTDTSEICSDREEVLQFANTKHLVPTFSFYDSSEKFYFAYVLNEYLTDKNLIQSIVNNLLVIFADYRVDTSYKDLSKQSISIELNISNLIVSNLVYIPVKGAIYYV